MKHVFFIFLLTFFSAFASAHRITPETMIRCRAGVTPDRCERQRATALAKKCIEPDEYEALKSMGGMPTCYEEDSSFMGWCPCGCFAADTKIKSNALNLIEEISTQNLIELFASGHRPQVAHLSSASTVQDLQFKSSPVRNVSVGPEALPLVVISTDEKGSAGQIALTTNHPVVLADGSIIRAERLQPGQKLLNYLGRPETIKTVARKSYSGLVYNFNVNSPLDNEHIVIANGLLMGDLHLQGSLSYFENQILVRK
jgi:hypothetical protein